MKYAACADQDYDPNAGTCAHVVFVEQPAMLPDLPIEDAHTITNAAVLFLGICWVGKLMLRYLRSI